MQYSTKIIEIYLKWFSMEDIYVYSIDEVFIDITRYLKTYNCTPRELATKVIKQVLKETGITATCGIGTNLYLAKIAMDIEAKKKEADEYGVRIAYLDENLYKQSLWSHMPITDFWRIGNGIARRLAKYGIYTMGDVARCAIENEELLFKEFGVNAEILIDHSFGIETVTIPDIKSYRPESTSVTVGQVIHCAYEKEKALLVVKEMTYELYEQLLEKHMLTNQIALAIGYDIEQKNPYYGEYAVDMYGRKVPKSIHSSINLDDYTNSFELLKRASTLLFDKLCDSNLLVRRLFIVATHTIDESDYVKKEKRLTLFDDPDEVKNNETKEKKREEKERSVEKTILNLKKKFGKNAVIKGLDLDKDGTTINRNKEIGGHKA
jgi:DNA polymerase V